MSAALPKRPKKGTGTTQQREQLSAESVVFSSRVASTSTSNHTQRLEISRDRQLNDSLIFESMDELHQLLVDVTGGIGKFVSMDQWSWPQIADTHIWFKELHQLFIYGLGLENGEKLDSAFRRLQMDAREFPLYVRMLMGVGIQQNIFDASWPDIPILDINWARQALKPLLEDIGPEHKVGLPIMLLRSLADDELLNARLAEIPEKFAWQLLDDMSAMFVSFKDQSVQREHSSSRTEFLWEHCGKTMVELFRKSLELRLEMTFKGFEYNYSFFWPRAGQAFNEAYMDAEIDRRRVTGSKIRNDTQRLVIATLLPGISRVSTQSNDRRKKSPSSVSNTRAQICDHPEKVIVPALVFIGNESL